jgi:transposase InsO family protein
MQRKAALTITGVTRHQYYHKPQAGKGGRPQTCSTERLVEGRLVRVPDSEVVGRIHQLKSDPITDSGYQRTARLLMLEGYYIGPKKTQRLMGEQDLLAPRRKAAKRPYARCRVVTPERPLHVLEMDIKSKWVTSERRNGYILTIQDTFTRQALHWQAGLSMTQHQVTHAWDQVIKHHLQPADLLNKNLHVEVRSDNGPQFVASMVQGYFKANHLDQVFTHPYTPQENGHIESFHAILGAYLDRHTIWDLEHLIAVLSPFYDGYNKKRGHGSIAYLWPDLFEQAWHSGLIQRNVDSRGRVKFKLLVPYQELLSGCRSLKGVSCLIPTGSHHTQQVSGPGALWTPSVTQSPSVVSC